MNWFILFPIPFILVSVIIGFLAPLIGLIVAIAGVIVELAIFYFLTKGLPMEFIKAKFGGILFLVGKKNMELVAERKFPKHGMIETENHGVFRVMPERIYRCAGIPVAIASEDLAFNVGIDHAELANKLKENSVNSITDVSIIDGSKRVKELKDPGIKVPAHGSAKDIITLSDLAHYSVHAANPIYADALSKLKLISTIHRKEKSEMWKTILIVGLVIFFVLVGLTLLRGQNVTVTIVENMRENMGRIIPA